MPLYTRHPVFGLARIPIVCLATPVEDPERYAATQAHFAERGVDGVQYLHGLHKSTSGLTSSHPYMVDRPEAGAEPFYIGPHPVNIWIGHYMIWQALKLSGDSHWFVIECDTKFSDGWYMRTRQALHDVPADFDFLYLGSCCTKGFPRTRIGGDVYQMSGVAPQCNHGYIIAAKAVPTCERILRRIWAPIDIQQVTETFAGGQPLPRCVPAEEPAERLKAYVVLPRILDQFNTDIGEPDPGDPR